MHRRPRLSRRTIVVPAVALAVSAGLVGCSRGVPVAVPSQGASSACTSAGAAWPETVSAMRSVDTSPSSPAVHAWGDPAIIARCGVATPAPTDTGCLSVDGVDWVSEALTDGTRFTTYGRAPAIEVLIPRRYAPEPLLLPAFSAAVKTLPDTGHHCS